MSIDESILKKVFKSLFSAPGKKCNFLKNDKNPPKIDKALNTTLNQKLSMERQSPYSSSGTLGLKFDQPLVYNENLGKFCPLWEVAESERYVHIL